MVKSAREGRKELVMRVQAALNVATKKEAESLVNVLVSCLEDTLVEHLAEDGYSTGAIRLPRRWGETCSIG